MSVLNKRHQMANELFHYWKGVIRAEWAGWCLGALPVLPGSGGKLTSRLILALLPHRVPISFLNLCIFLLMLHSPHVTVKRSTTLCFSCESLPFHQGNTLLETEKQGQCCRVALQLGRISLSLVSAKCLVWFWGGEPHFAVWSGWHCLCNPNCTPRELSAPALQSGGCFRRKMGEAGFAEGDM